MRRLNHLIIQNNISDKTIISFGNVASWNIGCGSFWVEKTSEVKPSGKPRARGAGGSPSFTEIERLTICAEIIGSLEKTGMDAVLIQEGPSKTYISNNSLVKSSPDLLEQFGSKKEEKSIYDGQVWCYVKIKDQAACVRTAKNEDEPNLDSKAVLTIKKAARDAHLADKECQIVIVTKTGVLDKVYVNVHSMEWGTRVTFHS